MAVGILQFPARIFDLNVMVAGTSATITVGAAAAVLTATGGAKYTVQGLTISSSGSGSNGLVTGDSFGAISVRSGFTFGAFSSGTHILCQGGVINLTASYTISGGALLHMLASDAGASISLSAGITVTLSGTPAFTGQFAAAQYLSFLNAASVTFSGSATGTRYSSTANAVLYTAGSGASYLPCSTAGSTSNGGLYL